MKRLYSLRHSEIKKNSRIYRRTLNYIIDMGIVVYCLIQLPTGVLKFLNMYIHIDIFDLFSRSLSTLHEWSGIALGILIIAHLALHWKWIFNMTKKIPKIIKRNKNTLKYFTDIGMLISFLLVFITGVIKFPTLEVDREILSIYSILFVTIHDWGGIVLVFLALLHIILNWNWIVATTKKMFGRANLKKTRNLSSFLIFISILILPLIIPYIPIDNQSNDVTIAGIGKINFNPEEVETVRPDLFKDGHFSIFDILVYLDNSGKINMEYHFDADMDTFVVDSINGTNRLWYYAYYDGGRNENNAFRIDHYPYKPKMSFVFFQVSTSHLNSIYETFRREIARLNANNGSLIIPRVTIRSPRNNLRFSNVLVTAHNLRNDTFQDGVITGIDVILSLGDQGLITYQLKWYETIGMDEIKSYWVEGINADIAYARCGYVYEAGDYDFQDRKGNHIHIPSDFRIITSPQYEKWFWICI